MKFVRSKKFLNQFKLIQKNSLKVSSSSNSSPGILRKKELPPILSTAASIKQPATAPTSSRTIRKFGNEILENGRNNNSSIHDSVELSFIEKLSKAENSHKKDLEDLKAFEMLEEAANDSSFCSSSSTVKRLIQVVKIHNTNIRSFFFHTNTWDEVISSNSTFI